MQRIRGEKLGRWSLRLDAIYCALLGTGVALGAEWIGKGIALPTSLILGTGVAVVVWAGIVLWMLARLPLTVTLRLVAGANVLAALAVGLVSVSAATALIVAAVLAVAFDVALFAVSQMLALRTLPSR